MKFILNDRLIILSDRLIFFSEQQQEDVRVHLSELLGGDELKDALAAIDFACAYAEVEMLKSPGEWREHFDAKAWHFSRMLTFARNLRSSLRTEPPLWNTANLDWEKFDSALDQVIDSAQEHSRTEERPTRRGRPPEGWRDRLISVVHSIYPPGTAKKRVGSHFEDTVEILLGLLGREVEDVHTVILDALRRRPDPPYTVKHKRPT